MKKLLSLILALAMVLALVACGNKTTDDSNAAGNGDTTDADPIRIGFFAPVSAASAAADGQSAEQSAKLAVKLINEAGGILSSPTANCAAAVAWTAPGKDWEKMKSPALTTSG